jgi:hypothetical protein
MISSNITCTTKQATTDTEVQSINQLAITKEQPVIRHGYNMPVISDIVMKVEAKHH